MYRILIVEDDAGIARGVAEAVAAWGMEASCVRDFRDVMAEFAKYSPHLVLMDIGLPFMNGYHWCTEIRKVSKVPILFRLGQYEYHHGYEYRRRRFYRQAL